MDALKNWTPQRAHSFAVRRIDKIKDLLAEIAYCYGDVDQAVVNECDELIDYGFHGLKEFLDDALKEGRML